MEIKCVCDSSFKKYGRVIKGYDWAPLLDAMNQYTPIPADVAYVPSVRELEAVESTKKILEDEVFGELPIEIGYCNGNNYRMDALEYHRSSEVDIAVTDLIIMVGMQQDITDDYTYDTAKVELFRVPAGTAVELYATCLHYAPCNANPDGFRCVIVLPKGTNVDLTKKIERTGENALLTANNKWRICHKDSGITDEGAYFGMIGENITLPH